MLFCTLSFFTLHLILNHKPVKKILVFTSLGGVGWGRGNAHLDDFTADDYTVGK